MEGTAVLDLVYVLADHAAAGYHHRPRVEQVVHVRGDGEPVVEVEVAGVADVEGRGVGGRGYLQHAVEVEGAGVADVLADFTGRDLSGGVYVQPVAVEDVAYIACGEEAVHRDGRGLAADEHVPQAAEGAADAYLAVEVEGLVVVDVAEAGLRELRPAVYGEDGVVAYEDVACADALELCVGEEGEVSLALEDDRVNGVLGVGCRLGVDDVGEGAVLVVVVYDELLLAC